MGNKLMTKKQWKNKQFFFLLKTENKLKKRIFELCNSWKQHKHTHEMYSVLLTHKWTNLKGLTIEVIYLETLLKETGNKATLECSR